MSAAEPAAPIPEEYLVDLDRYFLEWIPQRLDAEPDISARFCDADAVAQICLTGHGGGDWHFVLGSRRIDVARGNHPRPSFTISLAADTWRGMRAGKISGLTAFARGKIKIRGSVRKLLRVARRFA
jgi:putative sterol carrier protein